MKSNLFKYIFIVFVIGIVVFAFFKIKRDEAEKQEIEQRICELEKLKEKRKKKESDMEM